MSATPPSLDTRAFAAIADADELLARPGLLAAFADAFGPDADATLVLAARDLDTLTAGFPSAAAEAGVAEDALPDVLALPVGPLAEASDELASLAHAVLAEAPVEGAFALLPRCTTTGAARLRELACHQARLAEVRAVLPERLALPAWYSSRPAPEYWDDVNRTDDGAVHQPDVYAAAAAIARATGASHIIDVGCGGADKLLALAGEFRLVGIDFGANLEHCRGAHPRHTWLQWDIDREPPPALPGSLVQRSVIVCADVIEHLVDPSGLLAGLRALAADAEAVLISTPDRERVRGAHSPGPPENLSHVREWTLAELVALLEAGGLTPAFAGHTLDNDVQKRKFTSLAIVDGRRGGPVAPAPAGFTVSAEIRPSGDDSALEATRCHLAAQGVVTGPVGQSSWILRLRAGELPESPWSGVPLRDALHHVRTCGFDAVDYAVVEPSPGGLRFSRPVTTGERAFPYRFLLRRPANGAPAPQPGARFTTEELVERLTGGLLAG